MEDKRRLPRWKIASEVSYHVAEPKFTPTRGFLEDLNLIGAKVYLRTNHSARTEVRLEIRIPGEELPIYAEGEILWQTEAKGALFPTGIRFTRFRDKDKEKIIAFVRQRKLVDDWWQEKEGGL